MRDQIVWTEGRALLKRDEAHDLFSVDAVGNADGRGFHHLRPLRQNRVDLERGDVDAAANDQLLLAAGDMEEAGFVEEAEIARAESAARLDYHRAVLGDGAIRVLAQSADFHFADFARRQGLAPAGSNRGAGGRQGAGP